MSAGNLYRAEKCPCGDRGCTSGNLRPVTFGQGVMQMVEAESIARKLNAYDYVVNLWQTFAEDCPIFARIPIVRYWAFGHYARGYLATKVNFERSAS